MLNKLQKIDKDTNDLIESFRDYLFSVGVRTSKERAWDILQQSYKLPFEFLISKNQSIKYQGAGKHISHKHDNQLMVIRNLGKFEVKGVVNKATGTKSATIKFTPSNDIKELTKKIEVLE